MLQNLIFYSSYLHKIKYSIVLELLIKQWAVFVCWKPPRAEWTDPNFKRRVSSDFCSDKKDNALEKISSSDTLNIQLLFFNY